MNARSIVLVVAVLSLYGADLNAQDPPPDLFAGVTPTTIPAVTFIVKADGLIRPGEPAGDLGAPVRNGESFTLKDGDKLRFYDRAQRTRYEVEARLSDEPRVLWVRTTISTGKDDLLGQMFSGSKVRVSTIPIK